jgi:MFS transporter, ACS family, aldohexuronate transporter
LGGASLQARNARGLLFLAIMTLGYAVYAADRTVLSSMLKPLSSSLQLSNLEIGALSASQYAGVLAFAFASGALSDRFGPRRVVAAGVAVFTLTTWGIGASQTFAQAFVLRLVSGFGEGLFWPAAMSAVAGRFGARKGAALGIFYAGFDIGGASGTALGSAAYMATTDWRTAFFVAPLLGLPVLGWLIGSREDFPRSSAARLSRGSLHFLKGRQTMVLSVFAFLATWASVWQVVYLPYYFSSVLGVGVVSSGAIAAAVLASGMLGKALLGSVSDLRRRDIMLAALSASTIVFYVAFFSEKDARYGVLLALGMGFVSSAIFPILQGLAADSAPEAPGGLLGITTTFQSVAAVSSTFIAASLFRLGVGPGIALDATVPAALMTGAAIFLREPRTRA